MTLDSKLSSKVIITYRHSYNNVGLNIESQSLLHIGIVTTMSDSTLSPQSLLHIGIVTTMSDSTLSPQSLLHIGIVTTMSDSTLSPSHYYI